MPQRIFNIYVRCCSFGFSIKIAFDWKCASSCFPMYSRENTEYLETGVAFILIILNEHMCWFFISLKLYIYDLLRIFAVNLQNISIIWRSNIVANCWESHVVASFFVSHNATFTLLRLTKNRRNKFVFFCSILVSGDMFNCCRRSQSRSLRSCSLDEWHGGQLSLCFLAAVSFIMFSQRCPRVLIYSS